MVRYDGIISDLRTVDKFYTLVRLRDYLDMLLPAFILSNAFV